MKLILFLLCLTGIVPVTLSTVAHKYHLIKLPMKWSVARNYCRTAYVDLAEIHSFSDWSRISAEAARKFMILPAWIGLYNNLDSWRWSFNNLPLKNTSLMNWTPNEPSNGNEACGAIDHNGNWFDYPCTDLKYFVCYDSRLSEGARFINYLFPLLNWFGAQAFCRQFHTDLPSATNSKENDDIKSQVLIFTSSWFGLFRDTWTWLDGTVPPLIPWSLFQPDNLFGAQNCGTFTVGLISDETCSSEFAFFCYSTPPVRHQQILRLQVKSDGSVLDPDVQSSVLEKLKQKLKERGMNTTVTWRMKLDGNIFYKNKKTL